MKRDFVTFYKQTVFGPLWFVAQPLFSTIIFIIIFGNIAQISTDGLPKILFYLSGIICWNYFSGNLIKISDTFNSNINLFSKVYFPRLCIPISVLISNLMTFLIQFILFIGIYLYFYFNGLITFNPTVWLFFFPVLILQLALLSLGVGMLVSSLTTKYRDLSFLLSFGVQLWMYATPIVYPSSIIPENWKWLLIVNPIAPVIDTFRYAFFGSGDFSVYRLMISLGITLVLLLLGIILFSRVEKSFVDTV